MMTSEEKGRAATCHLNEVDTTSKPRNPKFRFKSKRTSHRDDRPRSSSLNRHHRRKRRSRHVDDPSLYDNTHLPNTSSSQFIDPETAFRESLFDAMADDEGAQFWEGVYGQPIHTYPDIKESSSGELERMTDEEYTAFVRTKMYEKTHQHLIEEKTRRDAAKKERERLAKEGAKEKQKAEIFQREVEESLKRGEERQRRKAWSERWETYIHKWEILNRGVAEVHIASIPWPTESGSRKDIQPKNIERFFLYASTGGQPTKAELSKVLKVERIRWHPDKIQQKLGGQAVSEDVLQSVTSVFQIVDTLWTTVRGG
jgi:hypothetical protein